jgi:hypothetical protein
MLAARAAGAARAACAVRAPAARVAVRSLSAAAPTSAKVVRFERKGAPEHVLRWLFFVCLCVLFFFPPPRDFARLFPAAPPRFFLVG